MILLTTPLSLGDMDPTPYTHIRVIDMKWKDRRPKANGVWAKSIDFSCHAGHLVDGEFVEGHSIDGLTLKRFQLRDWNQGPTEADDPDDPIWPIEHTDYTSMVAKLTSASGVLIYDEVARELCQWMIDKGHWIGAVI